MKLSYDWLQSYFTSPLPPAKDLFASLSNHSFEVELDGEAKILPDRSADCLSHLGVAREVAAVLGLEMVAAAEPVFKLDPGLAAPTVKIETLLARRVMARQVTASSYGMTPDWIAQRLLTVGGHRVSGVVDVSNYVMFELGQPVHIFDAGQIQGQMMVRVARVGESIELLGGRVVKLDADVLIIADEAGPLDVAGIRGGARAAVTGASRSLILTVCNFDPVSIRRTARRLDLLTDAAKRFENNLSPAAAAPAMLRLTELVLELGRGARAGQLFDFYPNPELSVKINFVPQAINQLLGTNYTNEVISQKLQSLGVEVSLLGTSWQAVVPVWRRDLKIWQDLAEEVGRLGGYDQIVSQSLPDNFSSVSNEPQVVQAEQVRLTLAQHGFVEVYGSSLRANGEVKLVNAPAVGREFLRSNLTDGLIETLATNWPRRIFDHESLKLFEIGTVFPASNEEKVHLALGARTAKELVDVLTVLDIKASPISKNGFFVVEVVLTDVKLLSAAIDSWPEFLTDNQYQPVSPYPRIVRDVSLFVPIGTDSATVAEKIKAVAGPLLTLGPFLFDVFDRGEQRSLAFRLVFQSHERTLTDAEVNRAMSDVTAALNSTPNFHVRES
ncbi:MAG: phenylalanine--tRNA ligase subunit beta [Patescibacteria group bacterium]